MPDPIRPLPQIAYTPYTVLTPGIGEIVCPRKGLLAIGRCRQLQASTAAEGSACTCPAFHAYERRVGEAAKGEGVAKKQPPVVESDRDRQKNRRGR